MTDKFTWSNDDDFHTVNPPVAEVDIIKHATDLNGAPLDDMVSGHKFDDQLSAALYILCGNGFADDEITNSETNDTGWLARVDRFVVLEDTQGFVNTRTFDTAQHAIWHMSDVRRDLNNPY